ncbi:MAG: GTP cyclohydrolase I FolE [Bacteroidales bacterium]|jgi:GTP cyclohydrolase I|nr:GTP cyclohydrolase I FolE [Bacteroidales bacterium]
MEIINNGIGPAENEGYNRVDKYDDQKTEELTGLYKQVLDTLGEDVRREGLDQTPLRVAKSMQFLTQGYGTDPDQIISQAMFKEDYSEMVIVKDIDVFSLCEHHLIPFIGKAHVAYIPNGYITGLSKIARVVEAFSRRLQVQERLTMQIRDCLESNLKPLGVAVVIEAKHLCMVMRGIQKQNSVTTTSAFTGGFLNSTTTREEFIHLIGTSLI